MVGVYVHKLKDEDGYTTAKGANPFASIKLNNGKPLDQYVKAINPAGDTSTEVYKTIKNNLAGWVEGAIVAR